LTVERPVDLTVRCTLTVLDAGGDPIAVEVLEPDAPHTTVLVPTGEHAFEVHDQQGRLLQRGRLQLEAGPATLKVAW
jgi:hypothetical protein